MLNCTDDNGDVPSGVSYDDDDGWLVDWLCTFSHTMFYKLIRCGQKKKLVINSGNGKVEDRKPSELNGEASKSQEMVHLVNKEPSETPDQFTTTDETRNLQNVDMKIGV